MSPLRRTPQQEVPERNSTVEAALVNLARRALCADDDEHVRGLLAHILSSRGYEVSVARDGAEAAALATSIKFDVVITDHEMPEMTGLELVRHLRRMGFAGKVFVFSGALSLPLREEYEGMSVDAIAAKPTGASQIFALI